MLFFETMKTLARRLLLVALLWSQPLFAAGLNGIESSLTIYAYPSTNPLNWSSPRSALLSFLGIEIERQLTMNEALKFENQYKEQGSISSTYKSTMGHTIAHIQCKLSSGSTYEKWTSFSGQNYSEVDMKNIFDEKLGLGVLFHSYVDGHIIDGEENRLRITAYEGSSRENSQGQRQSADPRYLQVEIDAAACDRLKNMVSFFEGFHFPADATLAQLMQRPANKVLYFNSFSDPLKSYYDRLKNPSAPVGGGCAPYGIALLKMAGRYDTNLDKEWLLNLKISEKLIGGIPDNQGGTRRVDIKSLLLGGLGSQWEHEGYRSREMNVYDPSKIWSHLNESILCLESGLCDEGVQPWVRAHKRSLEVGKTEVFKASYTTIVSAGYESYPDHEREIQRTIKQKVRGLILRKTR